MTDVLDFVIMEFMRNIEIIYKEHAEIPYIAPEYEEELLLKPIAKRQMIRTEEGLLPGHIIMLWRIQFGSYRTDSPHHKYFATTYGINAQKELEWLIAEGYVRLETALEALRHLSSTRLKLFLKAEGIKGLSKMKRDDLDSAMCNHFTEAKLSELYDVRGYLLTPKGSDVLAKHPEIVDKHPKKKL